MEEININSEGTEKTRVEWRVILSVCGAFMVQIPLGFGACWGNVGVYVLSYFLKGGAEVDGLQNWSMPVYIVALMMGRCFGGPLGSWNQTVASMSGIAVFDIAIVCFYWTVIDRSVLPFYFLLVCIGFATGSLETSMVKYVTDSTSNSSMGVWISISLAGVVVGSSFINPILTMYVNPSNLTPGITEGKVKLFDQEQVLDKVPSIFLVFGCISLLFHMIGLFLMNLKYIVKIFYCKRKTVVDNDVTNSENQVSYTPKPAFADQKTINSNPENSINSNTDAESTPILKTEPQRHDTDENPTNECNESSSLTTGQILRQPLFYMLWFLNLAQEFPYLYLSNYYKLFGQNWIKDDHFLSLIGSAFGVIRGICRLVWGVFLNKFGVKTGLLTTFGLMSLMTLFLYFSVMLDKWLYLVAILVLAGAKTCVFPSLITAQVVEFGKEHSNKTLGLMLSGSILGILLAPLLFESLLAYAGWFYIFFISALFCSLGFVWVLFM